MNELSHQRENRNVKIQSPKDTYLATLEVAPSKLNLL